MCNGKSKCGSNWNKNQTEEVVYFLTSLIHKKSVGLGPIIHELGLYILESYKHADTLPTLKAFLSNQNGGRAMNCDNTKAIGGFKRAASEWFACLGLSGI